MAAEKSTERRKGRLVPPKSLWITWTLLAAVIAGLRYSDVIGDHAISNILTILAAFVGTLLLGVWFFFFSRFPRLLRAGVAAAGLVLVGFLAITYEVTNSTLR